MDPASLLNPRGARQRGSKPTSSSFDPPSFSFSTPYSAPSNSMSGDSGYWAPPPPPYGMQQMSPQTNPGARAPDVPQPMSQSGATQPQSSLHTTPQFQQFDARALLNPKSVSKRPAIDQAQEFERGREDPAPAGQVSLVERLHHVQERTASPAKRARTEDEHRKAAKGHIGFGSGGALDLNRISQQPVSTKGPSIDLTMSKVFCVCSLQKLTAHRRRRRRVQGGQGQLAANHLHRQNQACIRPGSPSTLPGSEEVSGQPRFSRSHIHPIPPLEWPLNYLEHHGCRPYGARIRQNRLQDREGSCTPHGRRKSKRTQVDGLD